MALGYGRVGTNQFACAKFIVDTNGLSSGATHTTIAAALSDASSNETIFIKPGTYTEDLTLKAGVNLVAFSGDEDLANVEIVGKCTFTAAGSVSLSNLRLTTNGDYCLSVTGTSASVVFLNGCYINASDNTAIEFTTSSSSAQIYCNTCTGDVGTTLISLFASTSSGQLRFHNCDFENSGSTTTSSTMAGGNIEIRWTRFQFPIETSSTCLLAAECSVFRTDTLNITPLIIGSSGDSFIRNCDLRAGSATAMTVSGTIKAHLCDFETANAAAISGAGSYTYSLCTFSLTSSDVTVTTQNVANFGPSATCGSANSGGTNTFTVENSSNTASSAATIDCQVAGGTAGDATYLATVSGGQSWAFGLDNGSSDSFAISQGGALGSSDVMTITTAGEINYPLQPAFSARLTGNNLNVTGAGTAWTVVFNSEIFDQNSDYNTSTYTFTAPITGRYLFTYNVSIFNLTSSMTAGLINIITSNRTYVTNQINYYAIAAPGRASVNASVLADMDASDTCYIELTISNGAGDTADVDGNTSNHPTVFEGWLVC